MQFFNFTGFAAAHTILADKNGLETLFVVSKATFKIGNGNKLEPSEKQANIILADEYYGDPSASSIKYESEIAIKKPKMDIILIGHAYNQGGKKGFVDVTLRFENVVKMIRVFGDRVWEKGVIGYSISKPAPFDNIPLKYELAYGGIDDSIENIPPLSEPRNPVGIGFFAKGTKKKIAQTPLPNLEDPENLINKPGDSPYPACFGFVSGNWTPRMSLAGDFGKKWQEERMPLLPLDFDENFYNSASRGLVLDSFVRGGEKVEIRGASSNGLISFVLPGIRLEAVLSIGFLYESKDVNFDTVIIDTDRQEVNIIGRSSFTVHNRIYDIKFVKLQSKD